MPRRLVKALLLERLFRFHAFFFVAIRHALLILLPEKEMSTRSTLFLRRTFNLSPSKSPWYLVDQRISPRYTPHMLVSKAESTLPHRANSHYTK